MSALDFLGAFLPIPERAAENYNSIISLPVGVELVSSTYCRSADGTTTGIHHLRWVTPLEGDRNRGN